MSDDDGQRVPKYSRGAFRYCDPDRLPEQMADVLYGSLVTDRHEFNLGDGCRWNRGHRGR